MSRDCLELFIFLRTGTYQLQMLHLRKIQVALLSLQPPGKEVRGAVQVRMTTWLGVH